MDLWNILKKLTSEQVLNYRECTIGIWYPFSFLGDLLPKMVVFQLVFAAFMSAGVLLPDEERARLWRPPHVPHLLTWPLTDLRATPFHTDTCKVIPDLLAVTFIRNFHFIWLIFAAYVSFQLTHRSDSLTYMCNPLKQPIYETIPLS